MAARIRGVRHSGFPFSFGVKGVEKSPIGLFSYGMPKQHFLKCFFPPYLLVMRMHRELYDMIRITQREKKKRTPDIDDKESKLLCEGRSLRTCVFGELTSKS